MVFKFYDYLYYRTYDQYLNKWKDSTPMVYSLGFVSFIQFLNFISVYSFVLVLFSFNIFEPIFGVIILSVFMLVNFVRYSRFYKYQSLELKWQNETDKSKIKRGRIIIGYIIISIMIFIFSAQFYFEVNN